MTSWAAYNPSTYCAENRTWVTWNRSSGAGSRSCSIISPRWGVTFTKSRNTTFKRFCHKKLQHHKLARLGREHVGENGEICDEICDERTCLWERWRGASRHNIKQCGTKSIEISLWPCSILELLWSHVTILSVQKTTKRIQQGPLTNLAAM